MYKNPQLLNAGKKIPTTQAPLNGRYKIPTMQLFL